MKGLYIICHGLWSNKGRITILVVQILLMCLVFNILVSKFMYLDRVRSMIWASRLDNAVFFEPAPRFSNLIDEKLSSCLDRDFDESRYKSYYEMKEQIGRYPGIETLGSIRRGWGQGCILDKETGTKLSASFEIYDESLIKSLNLSLAQGKLSNLLRKDGRIPVIVTYPLGKMYGGMGSEIELIIRQNGKDYSVRTVVAGILDKDHFLYVFPGGSNAEDAMWLTDLASRRISHDKDFFMIMPPFTLDDNSAPITADYPSFVCFADKSVNIDRVLPEWKKEAEKDGLGFFMSFRDLNKRQIDFTLTNNLNFISLGFMILLIALAGIGGFNILRLIKEKRETAIYFMAGMDWQSFMLFETLKNCLIVSIPACLALATTAFLVKGNLSKMMFGPLNFILTLAVIMVFVLATVVIIRFMTRDRNIVMLMRKDEE